jgi:integrase
LSQRSCPTPTPSAGPNRTRRDVATGTATAYGDGHCRCRHCRDVVAFYRAARRAAGKDSPRRPRTVDTDIDRHISRGWFRNTIWLEALAAAELGFHITPHGLRHAHASWLLAGGADLQVVKERLGHASITTTEKYLHKGSGIAADGREAAGHEMRTVESIRICLR